MDQNTALSRHRHQRITQLAARVKKSGTAESKVVEFKTGYVKDADGNIYIDPNGGHFKRNAGKYAGTFVAPGPGTLAGIPVDAIRRHRLMKITERKGDSVKSTENLKLVRPSKKKEMSAIERLHEFAYRDEYGRYQEDDRARNAGVGAGAATAAIGAGLYTRGRMKGVIGPSRVERYAADKFQGARNSARGVIGRQTGTVNGGMTRAASMGDQARFVGKTARSSFRGARTEIGNRGIKSAPKVSRKYLRAFLTRAGRGLAGMR